MANPPGSFIWYELMTPDPDTTRRSTAPSSDGPSDGRTRSAPTAWITA